jgi:hypothetical protein
LRPGPLALSTLLHESVLAYRERMTEEQPDASTPPAPTTPTEPSPFPQTPAAAETTPPPPPVWPAHAQPPAPGAGQPTAGQPQPIPGQATGYPAYPAGGYPPGSYPPGAYAPGTYAPGAYGYAQPASTSTSAIVGLILSIVAWVVCPVVPAIIALVLAHKSDREISASQGRVGGAGLNTATRIISWINIGLYAAVIVGLGLFFLVVAILSAVSSSA